MDRPAGRARAVRGRHGPPEVRGAEVAVAAAAFVTASMHAELNDAYRGRYRDRELTVAFQLQQVGGQLLRRATKTETSDETMPLPALCVAALASRSEFKRDDRAEAGVAWQGSPLVFTTARRPSPSVGNGL